MINPNLLQTARWSLGEEVDGRRRPHHCQPIPRSTTTLIRPIALSCSSPPHPSPPRLLSFTSSPVHDGDDGEPRPRQKLTATVIVATTTNTGGALHRPPYHLVPRPVALSCSSRVHDGDDGERRPGQKAVTPLLFFHLKHKQ